MDEIELRYGLNPHQRPARASAPRLPFRVLNGAPGYINLLDSLNAWQLVRELRVATGLPAAASFKHVRPSGAAIAVPMNDAERRACFVEDLALSPLATAYARARGAERLCSYLDWAAMSDPVDVSTAELLRREASDGVIAPGYEPGALAILTGKRGGRYCVLEIQPDFEPPALERRDVFGVTLEQPRDEEGVRDSLLSNVVTKARLPEEARRDLIVALIATKYTQSNSVALVRDGQVIGSGAGQQSRVHCVRLAVEKARLWHLRQHARVLTLPLRDGLSRPEKDNVVDAFVRDDMTTPQQTRWLESFRHAPHTFTTAERSAWLAGLDRVALASDGLFPFRDNVDVASTAGVRYLAQPGGSARDAEVVAACDEYGMAMAFTDVRLFHH